MFNYLPTKTVPTQNLEMFIFVFNKKNYFTP